MAHVVQHQGGHKAHSDASGLARMASIQTTFPNSLDTDGWLPKMFAGMHRIHPDAPDQSGQVGDHVGIMSELEVGIFSVINTSTMPQAYRWEGFGGGHSGQTKISERHIRFTEPFQSKCHQHLTLRCSPALGRQAFLLSLPVAA